MDKADRIDEYFLSLDRKLFLDEENKRYSDVDSPLPIGHGQTISQPSLVLQMTKLLDPGPDSKVLEIGTGSGYQTALLAKFSKSVYTIELIKELSSSAEARLAELGICNVKFYVGDGSMGLPDEAPFDRIIVTAGAGSYPQKLVEQLGTGGRMLVPVGQRYSQVLLLISKDKDGEVFTQSLGGVVFVEFKGKYGF
jgi:protein-L-isoaspartate(D-aspartate) O-methyltransferase